MTQLLDEPPAPPAGFRLEIPNQAPPTPPPGFRLETTVPDAPPTPPPGFRLETPIASSYSSIKTLDATGDIATQLAANVGPVPGAPPSPPPDFKKEVANDTRGIGQRLKDAVSVGAKALKVGWQHPLNNPFAPAAAAYNQLQDRPPANLTDLYALSTSEPTDENMDLLSKELVRRADASQTAPGSNTEKFLRSRVNTQLGQAVGQAVQTGINKLRGTPPAPTPPQSPTLSEAADRFDVRTQEQLTPQVLAAAELARKGWANLTPDERLKFHNLMTTGVIATPQGSTPAMRTPDLKLNQVETLVENFGVGVSTSGRLIYGVDGATDPNVRREQQQVQTQGQVDFPKTSTTGNLTGAAADPGMGFGGKALGESLGLKMQGIFGAAAGARLVGGSVVTAVGKELLKSSAETATFMGGLTAAEQLKEGHVDANQILESVASGAWQGPVFHVGFGLVSKLGSLYKARGEAKTAAEQAAIDEQIKGHLATLREFLDKHKAQATIPHEEPPTASPSTEWVSRRVVAEGDEAQPAPTDHIAGADEMVPRRSPDLSTVSPKTKYPTDFTNEEATNAKETLAPTQNTAAAPSAAGIAPNPSGTGGEQVRRQDAGRGGDVPVDAAVEKIEYPEIKSHISGIVKSLGGIEEHQSDSGSVYYKFPEITDADGYVGEPFTLRISDHYIPQTDERLHDKSYGRGPRWHELVFDNRFYTRDHIEKTLLNNAPNDVWEQRIKAVLELSHALPEQSTNAEVPRGPQAAKVRSGVGRGNEIPVEAPRAETAPLAQGAAEAREQPKEEARPPAADAGVKGASGEQGSFFSNTKKAIAEVQKRQAARKGKQVLGSGFGNLSDALEDAVHIGVNVVKDLAAGGKHGFEHFVTAIKSNIADARLRNFILRGERNEKGLVGGARAIYNAVREHPEITAHGLENTMTPDKELPNSLQISVMSKRTPEQAAAHQAEIDAAKAMPAKPLTERQTIKAATVPGAEVQQLRGEGDTTPAKITPLGKTPTVKQTVNRETGQTDESEAKALAAKMKAAQAGSESGYKAAQQVAAHDLAGTILGMKWEANNAAQFQQAVRTELAERASELPPEVARDFSRDIATAKSPADYRAAVERMQKRMGVYGLSEGEMATKIADAKRTAELGSESGRRSINQEIMNTVAPPQDTVAVGKAIRASMEIHAKGERALEKLEGAQEVAQDVKRQITDVAKDLPQDLRGQFLSAVRDAKTTTDLRNAMEKMHDAVARYELRSSWLAAQTAIDNINMTKMDPENRALARGAIARLKQLGEKLFTAGEDRFTHAQRRQEIETYTKQLNDAATDAKAARVADGTKALLSAIHGLPRPPQIEAPKRGFYNALKDALETAKTDVRLKYQDIKRTLGNKAYEAVVKLATTVEQRNGIVRRFLDGKLVGKTDAETSALRAGFLALGYHNNAEALRAREFQKAFDSALERGADEKQADAASAGAATGINDIGRAEAEKLRQNPKLMAAVREWQKNIEPDLIRIRKELGLPVDGWGDVDTKKFRLNLTTVRDAPRNLGLFGSDVNMKSVYDQEAFGSGEYVTDPLEALQSIVGKHLFMESFRNATDTMRGSGLEVEPSKTYERDGKTYAVVNGREHEMVNLTVANPDGEGVASRFYPKELIDAYKEVASVSRNTDHHNPLERVVNTMTKARLAAGIDVGLHGARVTGRVGAKVAASGRDANVTGNPLLRAAQAAARIAPWIGNRVAAVHGMVQMATKPIGEAMQVVLERHGADRGVGLLTKTEGKPTALWQNMFNWGHDAIQGNKYGMDTLGRREVARSYLHAIMGDEMRVLTKDVNEGRISPIEAARQIEKRIGTNGSLRLAQEVNNTMGYMNRVLRAGWINKTQFFDPFIGTQVGMIPDELKQAATLGISPTKIKAAMQRGDYKQAVLMASGSIMASIVGTYVAKNILNHAVTGHFMSDNDDGHKDDVALGNGMHWSNMDPSEARASNLLGVADYENSGSFKHAAGAAGQAWLNQAMSTLFANEAMRKAFQLTTKLATGTAKEPHFFPSDKNDSETLMKARPGWQYPLGAGQILAEEAAKHEAGEPTNFGRAAFRQSAAFAGAQITDESPGAIKRSEYLKKLASSPLARFLDEQRDKRLFDFKPSTPEQKAKYAANAAIVEKYRAALDPIKAMSDDVSALKLSRADADKIRPSLKFATDDAENFNKADINDAMDFLEKNPETLKQKAMPSGEDYAGLMRLRLMNADPKKVDKDAMFRRLNAISKK